MNYEKKYSKYKKKYLLLKNQVGGLSQDEKQKLILDTFFMQYDMKNKLDSIKTNRNTNLKTLVHHPNKFLFVDVLNDTLANFENVFNDYQSGRKNKNYQDIIIELTQINTLFNQIYNSGISELSSGTSVLPSSSTSVSSPSSSASSSSSSASAASILPSSSSSSSSLSVLPIRTIEEIESKIMDEEVSIYSFLNRMILNEIEERQKILLLLINSVDQVKNRRNMDLRSELSKKLLKIQSLLYNIENVNQVINEVINIFEEVLIISDRISEDMRSKNYLNTLLELGKINNIEKALICIKKIGKLKEYISINIIETKYDLNSSLEKLEEKKIKQQKERRDREERELHERQQLDYEIYKRDQTHRFHRK